MSLNYSREFDKIDLLSMSFFKKINNDEFLHKLDLDFKGDNTRYKLDIIHTYNHIEDGYIIATIKMNTVLHITDNYPNEDKSISLLISEDAIKEAINHTQAKLILECVSHNQTIMVMDEMPDGFIMNVLTEYFNKNIS